MTIQCTAALHGHQMHHCRGDCCFVLQISKHVMALLSSSMHVRSCFEPTSQSAFHLKVVKVFHTVAEHLCVHFTQGETEALRGNMICFK